MYARASLIRGTGLFALTLSIFYGCGGLNEADIAVTGSGNNARDGGSDATVPLNCGNGQIDPGEDCDGKLLNGKNCASLMLTTNSGGRLACKINCTYDTSSCTGGGTGGQGGGTGGTGFGTGGRFGGGTGGRFSGTGGRGTGTGGATGGGAVDVQCTSNGDCTGTQVCCGVRTNGQFSSFACQRRCTAADVPTECAKASDCGQGQVCCGTLAGNANSYTDVACAATCPQTRTSITFCASNAECPQGQTCQTSLLLPTDFKVCR